MQLHSFDFSLTPVYCDFSKVYVLNRKLRDSDSEGKLGSFVWSKGNQSLIAQRGLIRSHWVLGNKPAIFRSASRKCFS